MKMFHGGPSGLSAGKFILPPIQTKVFSCSDVVKENNPHRTDRVYVTPIFRCAEMFAALAPSISTSIYEVEVIGDLEADVDCDDPTMSFQAAGAKIVRETVLAKPRRRRILGALGLKANF